MKKLILASACAAALLSAAYAGAGPLAQAGAQPPSVSTAPPAALSPGAAPSPSGTPSGALSVPVQPTAPGAQPAAPATESQTPAQHLGRWHQACDGDVARFCGGITSKPAITACLDRNTANLSSGCKAIRAEEEQRWRSEHHRR